MTQNDALLARLQRGGILTGWDALHDKTIGTMKLATRIGELIRQGHDIEKLDIVTSEGKRIKGYRLKIITDEVGQGLLGIAV